MPAESHSADASPESPQVATRRVVYAALGFLGFVALSVAGLRGYYAWMIQGPVAVPPRQFPEPRLSTDTDRELEARQAQARRRLSTYAWTDQARGLVQVPIERAMDLLAGRGQEAYAPLEAPAPAAPAAPAPLGQTP